MKSSPSLTSALISWTWATVCTDQASEGFTDNAWWGRGGGRVQRTRSVRLPGDRASPSCAQGARAGRPGAGWASAGDWAWPQRPASPTICRVCQRGTTAHPTERPCDLPRTRWQVCARPLNTVRLPVGPGTLCGSRGHAAAPGSPFPTTRVTFWAVLTSLLVIKIAAHVTGKLDRGQPGWPHTRPRF